MHTRRPTLSLCALILSTLGLSACVASQGKRSDVISGVVLSDDGPVALAEVKIWPEGSEHILAIERSNADGHFSVTVLIDKELGAEVPLLRDTTYIARVEVADQWVMDEELAYTRGPEAWDFNLVAKDSLSIDDGGIDRSQDGDRVWSGGGSVKRGTQ